MTNPNPEFTSPIAMRRPANFWTLLSAVAALWRRMYRFGKGSNWSDQFWWVFSGSDGLTIQEIVTP